MPSNWQLKWQAPLIVEVWPCKIAALVLNFSSEVMRDPKYGSQEEPLIRTRFAPRPI